MDRFNFGTVWRARPFFQVLAKPMSLSKQLAGLLSIYKKFRVGFVYTIPLIVYNIKIVEATYALLFLVGTELDCVSHM